MSDLKSIVGEMPNWIFEYLELSDEIKKEWKEGSKASAMPSSPKSQSKS